MYVGGVEHLASHDLGAAAVHLERAHGCDQDHAVGHEAAVTALDVKELLHADIGAKAGLSQHIAILAYQLERNLIGYDRGVAMCDVGKRACVYQRRRAFQRLHQRRLDGILHEHGQRAGAADILGRDRFALLVQRHHHATQPLAHVVETGRKRQDRHDLAGNRDVEASHTFASLLLRPLANRNLAQHAVIDVHHAPPRNRRRIDVETHEAARSRQTSSRPGWSC